MPALVLVTAVAVMGLAGAVAARPAEPTWLSVLNGSGNNFDQALAVATSPDGSKVFVTGLINGIGPDQEFATLAYSAATGRPLWLSHYNGSSCTDVAEALACSPDGTMVFVTGSSGCIGDEDYATVAYDADTGEELWVRRYNGPTDDPDEASAIAVDPDGERVFVTGRSFGPIGEGRDYATVAYAAASGQELWVRRYAGPGPSEKEADDEAQALAVSPDGTMVYVTGASAGLASSRDYATLAYDAVSGDRLWLRRYDGRANSEDLAQALAVSPDGSTVFVTGYSFGVGTFSDYATLAYDAHSGQTRWLRRLDGRAHGFDTASVVAVSPDGQAVFVAGTTEGLGTDFTTVAYDAISGNKRWQRRYDGPGHDSDSANAAAVSPDGATVFVAGLSAGNESVDFPFDCATLAYDTATGNLRWVRRYNGPANQSDLAAALAVSPDGSRVFVTGTSHGGASGFDYLTLAYDARR